MELTVKLWEIRGEPTLDEDCQKLMTTFLSTPLESIAISVLKMNQFPKLMGYLPFLQRRTVSMKICEVHILKNTSLNA